MRTQMVAANWKMYGDKAQVAQWLEIMAQDADKHWAESSAEVVFCPPYPYLMMAERHQSLPRLKWGAQTLSESEQGAYTGDVSADMLRDLGCSYTIIGHSERRNLHKESPTEVAMKFAQAKRHHLVPILCVGEGAADRRAGNSKQVVASQIQHVLESANSQQAFDDVVVAYEPIWAIGTGHAASIEDIAEMHGHIRALVASELGVGVAAKLPLLYGGSVKSGNAKEIFALDDVDGGLVGSAALDAHEFLRIIACIQ